MKAVEALLALNEVTGSQWGMVTTAQAAQRGVSRLALSRLCDVGHLERVAHGVYRAASVPSGRFDNLKATWLSIQPKETAEERLRRRSEDAVVSGATASYLLGMGDLLPEPYEFTVATRRQTQRPELTFRVAQLAPDRVTLREGLPVTTPEQTIADLVESRIDRSLVADVLAEAGTIDRQKLSDLLDRLAARNGFKSGEVLLTELEKLARQDPESQAKAIAASALAPRVVEEFQRRTLNRRY
ncbi:MAG: type IV toxin-antitoxin system AbiEi family antitoxin domain-containing protein [Propionibacteriaceae bacterium]|jgi:predicted transcriptional regulator of viral defense system|nr:type IV toxin-antitoxin system AbiEi family antitoxin domain-containing protein [Propionibacteriaceae bacterium]